MADVKISGLPASITPLAGTEVLPIVQGGATKQVSIANVTAGRSVGATSFVPSGSTVPTNGVYLPAANTVAISTNSVNAVNVDASQRVVVGASTFLNYGGNASLAKAQVSLSTTSTNTVLPVTSFLRRSTGTPAAGIGAQIDLCADNAYDSVSPYGSIGCIGTDLGNISGGLYFNTMLNNASAERVRIHGSGGVSIGNTTDPGATNLSVTGSISSGSRAITRNSMPAGSVIQTVFTDLYASGNQSTSSATYVTSNYYSSAFTPSNSTSKINIFVTLPFLNGTGIGTLTLYRNGTTDIAPTAQGLFSYLVSGDGGTVSFVFQDSPATTSSTSYTVYWKTSAGTIQLRPDIIGGANILIQEIAV